REGRVRGGQAPAQEGGAAERSRRRAFARRRGRASERRSRQRRDTRRPAAARPPQGRAGTSARASWPSLSQVCGFPGFYSHASVALAKLLQVRTGDEVRFLPFVADDAVEDLARAGEPLRLEWERRLQDVDRGQDPRKLLDDRLVLFAHDSCPRHDVWEPLAQSLVETRLLFFHEVVEGPLW